MVSNQEIAEIFNLTGEVLTLLDENPFKVRSYFLAAQSIKKHPKPLALMTDEEILAIKGVGKNLLPKIKEIIATGALEFLQKKAEKIPEGVLQMLQIKGIGPKKVRQLWKELGITSPGELLYACYENRLVSLKGFGEKTQEHIKEILEFHFKNAHKYHFPVAWEYAQEIISFLEKKYGLSTIDITGSLRRKQPVIEKIELLVTAEQEIAIENIDFSPIPAIIYQTSQEEHAYQLFITTGSHQHTEKLSLNGLETCLSEMEIYEKNQLPYIPPELRENRFEWNWAKHTYSLICMEDIKGLVHCHTQWSDGQNTLEEMVNAARAQKMEYIVITDHSKSAFYANGLSEERIKLQQEEIYALQEKYPDIKIYSGIEADIRSDGSIDYSDEILKTFDVVIASIHSGLKMNQEKATERVLQAIKNPYVHMIGHISGRLLLSRQGYPLDYEKIFDAAVETNTVIEINANPMRLDIDWELAGKAKNKGVKFSINPDAHNISGIKHIEYGVYMAVKAALSPQDVVNTYPAEKFIKTLKKS